MTRAVTNQYKSAKLKSITTLQARIGSTMKMINFNVDEDERRHLLQGSAWQPCAPLFGQRLFMAWFSSGFPAPWYSGLEVEVSHRDFEVVAIFVVWSDPDQHPVLYSP